MRPRRESIDHGAVGLPPVPSCWTRPSRVRPAPRVGFSASMTSMPSWIEGSPSRGQRRSLFSHGRQVHQPVEREDHHPERPTGCRSASVMSPPRVSRAANGRRHVSPCSTEALGPALVWERSTPVIRWPAAASGAEHSTRTAPEFQDGIADDLGQPEIEIDVLGKSGMFEVVQLGKAPRTGRPDRRLTTASSCPPADRRRAMAMLIASGSSCAV